jgi:two-component system chemotaxis response regulator CheY
MADAKKPRVMVADDEKHIRALMKAALVRINCEIVAEAKDGQETVDLYRRFLPDMLLLDINMPLKSGEEVLREIRDEFPDALIVILSSVSDLETVENMLMAGASNFIRKDTPLKDMLQIIRDTWVTHLKKKPGARSSQTGEGSA